MKGMQKMLKVKDTLKRNIKFPDVEIIDGKLMDDCGDVVSQIINELPSGTESFELQINVALPIVEREQKEEKPDEE